MFRLTYIQMLCEIIEDIRILLPSHLHIHKAKVQKHFQDRGDLSLSPDRVHEHLQISVIKNLCQSLAQSKSVLVRRKYIRKFLIFQNQSPHLLDFSLLVACTGKNMYEAVLRTIASPCFLPVIFALFLLPWHGVCISRGRKIMALVSIHARLNKLLIVNF